MKSVYDTAPWRADANPVEKKKEATVESKSRQRLNKLPDQSLMHWKNKQDPIVNQKRDEQFLSTRRDMAMKHFFASDVTQLVDYDGYHPHHPTKVKEEKLERRDDTRIADVTSDLSKSPFKGLFSRMPAYTDFLLPNAEELSRTPRHSSSDASDPTEDPDAGQPATKTPPRWNDALATLSPDQVRLTSLHWASVLLGYPKSLTCWNSQYR